MTSSILPASSAADPFAEPPAAGLSTPAPLGADCFGAVFAQSGAALVSPPPAGPAPFASGGAMPAATGADQWAPPPALCVAAPGASALFALDRRGEGTPAAGMAPQTGSMTASSAAQIQALLALSAGALPAAIPDQEPAQPSLIASDLAPGSDGAGRPAGAAECPAPVATSGSCAPAAPGPRASVTGALPLPVADHGSVPTRVAFPNSPQFSFHPARTSKAGSGVFPAGERGGEEGPSREEMENAAALILPVWQALTGLPAGGVDAASPLGSDAALAPRESRDPVPGTSSADLGGANGCAQTAQQGATSTSGFARAVQAVPTTQQDSPSAALPASGRGTRAELQALAPGSAERPWLRSAVPLAGSAVRQPKEDPVTASPASPKFNADIVAPRASAPAVPLPPVAGRESPAPARQVVWPSGAQPRVWGDNRPVVSPLEVRAREDSSVGGARAPGFPTQPIVSAGGVAAAAPVGAAVVSGDGKVPYVAPAADTSTVAGRTDPVMVQPPVGSGEAEAAREAPATGAPVFGGAGEGAELLSVDVLLTGGSYLRAANPAGVAAVNRGLGLVPARAVSADGAKFAALPPVSGAPVAEGKVGQGKKILNVAGEQDKSTGPQHGIASASVPSAMRLNSAEYQVATEPPEAVPALKLSAESASRPLGSVHELRPALAAQRAVAAVMDVVEIQLASHLQSAPSVRLQMKLGGEELSIKVALAGGEVRTQFHTDSAELRSALEYQWNVTRAEAPERTLRYLDPEFHGTGAGLSHGGGGSPHDEPAPHPQARLAAQEVFGEIGRSYVPGAGPAAPDLPLPPSHTSVHLHAVA